MSNKIWYSIFIILFILMPFSIISALLRYAEEKLVRPFKKHSRIFD